MGFWDSASQGLDTGVKLGAHAADRAADREMKQKQLDQQQEQFDVTSDQHERQVSIAEAADERKQKEYDANDMYNKAEKSVRAGHALFQAGKVTGDEMMQRQGVMVIADAHNKYWMDGNKNKIIFRNDSANDPGMAEKWDTDPNLKGKEIAVLSSAGGIMPFGTMEEAVNFAVSGLNKENFAADMKAAKANVTALNAKEEPVNMQVKDDAGKTVGTAPMKRIWQVGPDGPTSSYVPYTGPIKETPAQASVTATETILGRPRTEQEKRIGAKTEKPTSAAERTAANKPSTEDVLGRKQLHSTYMNQLSDVEKSLRELPRQYFGDTEDPDFRKEKKGLEDKRDRLVADIEELSGVKKKALPTKEISADDIAAEAKLRGFFLNKATGKWEKLQVKK